MNLNFLTSALIFCKEEEGGLVFFFSMDLAKEKLFGEEGLGQKGVMSGADLRKKLDAFGKKSKGPIFTSGNISQE